MALQHDDFIEYIQRLGYRSDEEGICFGLAHMGVQAILSEDLEGFEKHLKDIEEDIENEYKLGDLISKDDIRKMDGMTKDEISKLTDIRAFCDGVELYFQPQHYKDLFQEDTRPLFQDAMKTSPLIDSIEMTNQQGLYQAASFSGVYEEEELVELLKSLKEKIPNGHNKPIALELGSMKHSICVGYIPNQKQWVFIDANNLPPKRLLNERALAREIRRSLGHEKIILTSNIYSTENNKDAVDAIISDWKNNKIYKRIHTVTHEKAQYVYDDDETWLHHSARVGDLPLTQDLLAHGADMSVENPAGFTPLIFAAFRGHAEVVKALTAKDVSIVENQKHKGMNALQWASVGDHPEVVEALSRGGANVNVRDAYGRTPLMLAALFGHLGVVEVLIGASAKVNMKDSKGMNALVMALAAGHFDVAKALIRGGANVDAKDANGFTALMRAVQNGNLKEVNVLIDYGADVNATDADGQTPLKLAALFGHLEVVNALIARGANMENHNGVNALRIALALNSVEIVKALIDVKDADGFTALMWAARNSNLKEVSELIANGANVNIKDKDGKTALELAAPELKEAMLKQIATQNETALRKKLTFSNASVEETDSGTSSDVSHQPPTPKP